MKTGMALVLGVMLAAAGAAFGHGHGGGGHGQGGACEAIRCQVEAALDAACPCDTATQHGAYVRCVAHTLKSLSEAGTVPRNCRGKIGKCAARSTCGKADAVTCVRGTACGVARSADACQAAGGTVGTDTTCCAACPSSPSAAFVDAE